MIQNKVLLSYMALDGLFVVMGAIMMGFSVVIRNTMFDVPSQGDEAARNLLYQRFPLTAGIVNAAFIFVTFLATIPAIALPTRGWLKMSAYMVTFCALFSLVLGLDLWILTLNTKVDMGTLWAAQTPQVQELMQTQFRCCGYLNSTSPAFVTDSTCPSPAAAALMQGCSSPLNSFANIFIDNIFTAVFGIVGVDVVLVMATACLLKDRKEQERFHHIDEKSGPMGTF